MRNKNGELILFLDSINFPDIVVLTEHWLKCDELYCLENYVTVSKFCRSDSVHGGTLIMVKKKTLETLNFVNVDRFDYLLEEKCFEFSVIHSKRLNLYIIGLYRSPIANFQIFLKSMEAILSNISIRARLVVSGDFNVDFLDSSSGNLKQLTSLFDSFNIKMHVDSPTRITSTSSSALDYFCSNLNSITDCRVVNAGLSDHEAVVATLTLETKIFRMNKCRYGRLFTRRNYTRFKTMCNNCNWSNILGNDDPLEGFHSLLSNVFNKAFPTVLIKKKEK